MVKALCVLIVIGFTGLIQSLPGSGNNATQIAEATYKNNNCVNCHAKVDEPLRVSARYYEWQFSRHQEKGVSCDKCHGGDPTATDKDKAHVDVLRSSEAQSRLSRNNQAATCSACHQPVVNAFVQSAHYQKLKSVGLGPNCNTCHAHMATTVIYSPKEVANLCSNCHNAADFLPPRPQIPRRASEAKMALQRANGVINWAALLLTEGRRLGLTLTEEQNEFKLAQQLLSDAKVSWHTFKLEDIQKNADGAFQKGTKVKDGLRKKIVAD
ncbi:MAG: hypothetical protein L0226_14610 [Acidobacteria bacterium]|nr:hypothetical protein [Acidobacteriota bacterium]